MRHRTLQTPTVDPAQLVGGLPRPQARTGPRTAGPRRSAGTAAGRRSAGRAWTRCAPAPAAAGWRPGRTRTPPAGSCPSCWPARACQRRTGGRSQPAPQAAGPQGEIQSQSNIKSACEDAAATRRCTFSRAQLTDRPARRRPKAAETSLAVVPTPAATPSPPPRAQHAFPATINTVATRTGRNKQHNTCANVRKRRTHLGHSNRAPNWHLWRYAKSQVGALFFSDLPVLLFVFSVLQ